MFKKILKITISVLLISAIAFGVYSYRQKAAATTNQGLELKEAAVNRGDIRISFSSDGKTYLNVLKLKFQVSGQLKEVNVNVGDKVQKDAVIARLDDRDYINKLETAKLSYNQALSKLEKTKRSYDQQLISEKAKVDNLKMQLDNISLQYTPMLQLRDVYPSQDIEAKRLSYENARAAYESELKVYKSLQDGNEDIRLDEINVEQSRLAIKIAQDNLDNTVLKAPEDDEILSVSNRAGETVSSNTSNSSATDFVVMADTSKLSVIAQVPEADLPKVEKGQEAEFECDAFQGRTFKGKVASIDPLPVTDSSGIVTYTVYIDVEDKDLEKVKSGMSCTVSFIMKQKKNVVVIPNSSVKRVNGAQVVEMKDGNGGVLTRNIKTGLTDGKNVEVMEGLKEGEKIIIKDKK